jgi:methylenetetrahydrofolate dehydrogenase (NADP+)/methenyltetrahydrofolate cyclohydrolase
LTALVLDGRPIAARVLAELSSRSRALERRGIRPKLVIVSVGESAPARMYRRRLEKLGGRNGILVEAQRLLEEASVVDLEREVAKLSADESVHGIVVQMPLPPGMASADLATLVDPRKDVDGVAVENAGRLYLGLPARVPSTAVAMLEMVDSHGIDPAGKRAVVVGRSRVVGHAVAELLLHRNATVTIAHSKTPDLASVTRQAEILFAAVGKARLVTPEMIREGVVIIDAGINVVEGQPVGDVDFDGCVEKASAITPVPGGVGPVTNAVLLRSVVECAEQLRSSVGLSLTEVSETFAPVDRSARPPSY